MTDCWLCFGAALFACCVVLYIAYDWKRKKSP